MVKRVDPKENKVNVGIYMFRQCDTRKDINGTKVSDTVQNRLAMIKLEAKLKIKIFDPNSSLNSMYYVSKR